MLLLRCICEYRHLKLQNLFLIQFSTLKGLRDGGKIHSVHGNVSQKVINRVTYTRQNNIKTELKDTGSEDVTQAAEVHVKW